MLALRALEILEQFKTWNPSLLWAIENRHSYDIVRSYVKNLICKGFPTRLVITARMAILAQSLVIRNAHVSLEYALGSEALSW